MRRNNVSLRLPPRLLERVKRLAEAESISVNQLLTVAVAEKIARLDAEIPEAALAALDRMPLEARSDTWSRAHLCRIEGTGAGDQSRSIGSDGGRRRRLPRYP